MKSSHQQVDKNSLKTGVFDTFTNYISPRMPLFYVFLSGFGFSIQALLVKKFAEDGIKAAFQFVFIRGWIQLLIASLYVYYDQDRLTGNGPMLFGNTNRVRIMMFLRSFVGFGGIAFSFQSAQILPLGDSTVLVMLSPLFASLAGYFVLGEPWYIPEFCATVLSLIGAALVARPSFIFGEDTESSLSDSQKLLGVTYALLASVSAGMAYIFVRILGTTAKMPWSNVCVAQAIGQIVMSVMCVWIAKLPFLLTLTYSEMVLIVVGGVVGAISQIFMTLGMQREKSAKATAMRMSDVVFGFIWQMLFTSDRIEIFSVLGAAIVTTSIFIIILSKRDDSTKGSVDNSQTDNSKDNINSLIEKGDIQLIAQPMAINTHSITKKVSINELVKDKVLGHVAKTRRAIDKFLKKNEKKVRRNIDISDDEASFPYSSIFQSDDVRNSIHNHSSSFNGNNSTNNTNDYSNHHHFHSTDEEDDGADSEVDVENRISHKIFKNKI